MANVAAAFAFTATAAVGAGVLLALAKRIPSSVPRDSLGRHAQPAAWLATFLILVGAAGGADAVLSHRPDGLRLAFVCLGFFLLLCTSTALLLSEGSGGSAPLDRDTPEEPPLWPDFDEDYERWFGGPTEPVIRSVLPR